LDKSALKQHPDFSERWLHERIVEHPAILGLGDLDLIASEKTQPRAGRLDLLFHDDQLNRRYEMELMLGPTDPSHIIRCIEYWDLERRRYPAYDHVAVLVAEDITTRFLNVLALFAGSIPLIALQMSALRVDDKVVLHFTRVLDQTTLRSDDVYELGESVGGGVAETNREWWETRSTPAILGLCDEIRRMVSELSNRPHRLQYRRKVIDVTPEMDGSRRVWCQPKRTLVHIGAYLAQADAWVKRFEEVGFPTALKRGNRAARVTLTPEEFAEKRPLVREFLKDSVATDADE
jgi:hypothetical protein